MTFGSGSNGCLGHGNFNDVTQVHVELLNWCKTSYQFVINKDMQTSAVVLGVFGVSN